MADLELIGATLLWGVLIVDEKNMKYKMNVEIGAIQD